MISSANVAGAELTHFPPMQVARPAGKFALLRFPKVARQPIAHDDGEADLGFARQFAWQLRCQRLRDGRLGQPRVRVQPGCHSARQRHIKKHQADRANAAILTNLRAGQDDDELPEARASADGSGLDVCQGMDKGLGHRLDALLLIAVDGRLTTVKRQKSLKTGAWIAALRSQ